MTRAFLPNEEHLIISFQELEMAWRMLAAPDKQAHIEDALAAIQRLNINYGPQKAVFNMISATAWLTSDNFEREEQIGSGNG